MPVGAQWRHQLGDAVDQLPWREHQFTGVLVGLQRLAVSFAAAYAVFDGLRLRQGSDAIKRLRE